MNKKRDKFKYSEIQLYEYFRVAYRKLIEYQNLDRISTK